MCTSNNTYNGLLDRWEQHWIDNGGLTLHITGGLEEGKMIMSNKVDTVCNNVVWSPISEKEVRQEWFQSSGNCIEWNKSFDGHYKSVEANTEIEFVFPNLAQYSNVRDVSITTNGNEVYTTIQNASESIRTICTMKKFNGDWTAPKPASFSGRYHDLEPFLSPDKLRLYFASNRPNNHEKINFDIWYDERSSIDSSWLDPINIGSQLILQRTNFPLQ